MGDTVYASEEDTISKRQSDIYSWIKNKIENEGVQARNIIKYNVPVDAGDGPKRVSTMATRSDVLQLCPAIHGSRHTSGCGVSEQTEWSRTTSPQSAQTPRSSVGSHSFDRCVSIRSVNTISSTPSSCSSAKPHRRFNAASSTLVSSAARNARQTENEYRARYWGQMLDTLRRTIDEIYSACETDESEMECKEVIMILEHSKQDFHSLIEKMNLLREYERADDQNKPSALAWDERTTLPDKPIMRQVLASAAMAAASPPLDTFISVPAHLTLDVNGHDSDGSGSWRSIVKVAPSRAANHMGFGPPSSGATSSNPLAHTPSLKLRDIHHLSHVRSGSDLTNSALSSQRDDVLDDTMDDDMIGAALDGELGTNVLYSEDEADDADNDDDDDDTELVDIAISESNASEPKKCTRFSHSIPNSFLARRSPHGLDEDIEDPEDNTISRDLRQIDEAIATVTTAERMLTNRLGRAQCAEAALRRRLLAEDKTTSAHSSCQWRGHKKLGMKSSKVVRNAEHDGDNVEMNVNLLKGGVLLLPNDSVGDHSNLLIVNHTISSVDSGESDVAREVESVFSSKTNEFTVTPSIRHPRGATQSRRRQCCACACHETITSTASMTTSNGTSRSHKFKTPTVCAHSSGRVASSNLPVGRSQNTCPLRTSSDNRGSFPLEMLRQSNIVYYSPSGRSKTASDDCPVSEAAQPLSPRMDSTTMPTSVTHCSNDVNVGTLVSSNPHYMRAMVSPSMGVTAVETAKGLLFLSEMSAKSRTPGHGVQMHEKLSARSARKTANSMQELERKQARARVLRQQHLMERSERVHELSKKVEEVHMQKRILLHQRRSCLERRLHAAERKRKEELERRVLKAHDEETKGREIAFIQSLEAEQKQHSILTKHEESRARLHELAAERRRRLEEKLGREEAAKGRRRALEASRRARLDALQARWETRAQQLASRAERLEHTRRAAAKAKEQHREVKMASLEEQQRAHIEQLRARIQRKQEESERRHLESLREISRKAFEMSVLTHTMDESFTAAGMDPYPIQKWCRACQVMIVSEVSLKSHLHGKRHQKAVMEACENRPLDRSDLGAFNLSHLVDAPPDMLVPQNKLDQERLKIRRKRAKKLRQRMNQRAAQYMKDLEHSRPQLSESPNRAQLQKLIKDVRRLVNLPDSGPWVVTRVQAMEKTLNAILRCLRSHRNSTSNGPIPLGSVGHPVSHSEYDVAPVDQLICVHLGLLTILVQMIGLIRNQRPSGTQLVPDRSYQLAIDVLLTVCRCCPSAANRMLCSNDISILIDCLVTRLSSTIPGSKPLGTSVSKEETMDVDQCNVNHCSPCTLRLIDCLTCLLSQLATDCSSAPKSNGPYQADPLRIQDLLGYLVSSDLVDLLANRLSSPRQAHWLLRINNSGRNASTHSMEQAQRVVLSTIALLTSILSLYGRVPIVGSNNKTRAPCPDVSCPVNRNCVTGTNERGSSAPFNSAPTEHPFAADADSSGRGPSVSSHDTPLCSSLNSSTRCIADDHGFSAEHTLSVADDPTKLLDAVLSTEVFGLVPLLYCLLLDPSARPAQATTSSAYSQDPRKLAGDPGIGLQNTLSEKSLKPTAKPPSDVPFRTQAIGQITLQSLKLINSFAAVNRSALQSMLSSELTCLLVRHILLTLLARCANRLALSGCATPNPEPEPDRCNRRETSATKVPDSSTTRTTRLGNDPDGISGLVPSGARQVIVRSVQTSSKSFEQGSSSARGSTLGPPNWLDDGSPATSIRPRAIEATNSCAQTPVLSAQLTEAVLHEAVLCIGHLCALHPDNQTSLQAGPPPSILQHLVSLPFDYFSRRPLTDVLYPTLIACCYDHPINLAVLEAELSAALLANYIEERLLERAMDALSDTDAIPSRSDKHIDARFRFENRFPVCMWDAAKTYFTR